MDKTEFGWHCSENQSPTPDQRETLETNMSTAATRVQVPNDLEAFWLPFTPNRAFKKAPRLISRSKDMHYYTPEGREILDATAALWCCNAGHNRPRIVEAIQRQAAELDFSPTFQFAHPGVFALAARLTAMAPGDLDHAFFTNSGSEACDTALKIALAYHNVRGEGSRQRLIGRERGYHGVGFGGISVGGMVNNRKFFGSLLTGVDHLPATYNREQQAFTKGEPEWGGHLADDLERIVALHDASTIACVIVEPMAGSTGVLPPPKGYLQKLRAICDKYGILLVFDEVITGFGRLGAAFAAERYGVIPDIITFAKGVTSGTVPMGGVLVRKHIYDAFMKGPEHAIELFHGYTYSGHPLACAAALASLDVYRDEKLFERAKTLEPKWCDALMSLKGLPNVLDIRCLGLTGAIDLAPSSGGAGARGYKAVEHSFHEAGIMIRISGDTIELTPPLILSEDQIGEIVDKVGQTIKAVA
jgi:beta-alanine--pyruvate transaminase